RPRASSCGSRTLGLAGGRPRTRRHGQPALPPTPLLVVEAGAGWRVEQTVVAALAHEPGGIRPASPRGRAGGDDNGASADLHFDLPVQPRLLDQRLGQPDAARVADANEP